MEKRIEQIENITLKFCRSFGEMSAEDLNWKPGPRSWSIAQNIQHLIAVNESYFPVFENLKKGDQKLPFIARFDFVVSFFGNMILKSVQPENRKKMKTFPVWQPEKSDLPPDILDDFKNSQSRLENYIKESDDLIYQNTIISSPANKNIVYKLETAFEIIISHQERHYNQAVGILKKIQLSKTTIN